MEHFFGTYKQLEAATVVTQGWEPAGTAKNEILAAAERYMQKIQEEELGAKAKPVKKKSKKK